MSDELLTDWIQKNPNASVLSKGTGITPIKTPEIPQGLGTYSGGFNTPNYGTAYMDNGVLKMSSFGPDQAMDMNQFNAWAEKNPEAAAQAGSMGLAFGDNGLQIGSNGKPLDNGSWGYKQWGTAAGAGLGLGELGLGIANYMTQKKVADKQMRLLDQQYANNADLLAHRKSHRASIEKAFANNASNFA